jgi:hypothetical protein
LNVRVPRDMVGTMTRMMTGLTVVALVTLACARQTQTTPAAAPTQASSQSGSSRDAVLTSEQLLQTGSSNVFDAIAKLRPQCLRTRSNSTRARQTDGSTPTDMSNSSWGGLEIAVYQDGMRAGKAEELRNISVATIGTVECLSAADAAQRFGLNATGGAIVLTTRRR